MTNHPNRSKREPRVGEKGFYEALAKRFRTALEPAAQGALTYEQALELVMISTRIYRQGVALPVDTVENIIREVFHASQVLR